MIVIIVNKLTKIVNYNLFENMINITGLEKIIIDVIIKYYNLLDYSVSDKNTLFMSKF